MKVKDDAARNFYLEEAAKAGWSSRQLERQINSFYYQRILASKDKNSVSAEIGTLEPKPEYEKIIKDPYVLEFLDLPANEHFYESELEQALIDHLQKFLLELGRGYSFVQIKAIRWLNTLFQKTIDRFLQPNIFLTCQRKKN